MVVSVLLILGYSHIEIITLSVNISILFSLPVESIVSHFVSFNMPEWNAESTVLTILPALLPLRDDKITAWDELLMEHEDTKTPRTAQRVRKLCVFASSCSVKNITTRFLHFVVVIIIVGATAAGVQVGVALNTDVSEVVYLHL